MIYHLLHVSSYPERFIRFLIRNKDLFDLSKHHFIIETNGKKLFSSDILENISYSVTRTGWNVYQYLRCVKGGDKIIVHYLGNPRHLLMFILFPHLLRHVIWSIWGGDAYFTHYIKDCWYFRFYEYIRRIIIPRISLITCVVRGDYEFVVSKYGTSARYMKSIYPSDVNDESFQKLCTQNIEATDNIVLVGNSADPANNHSEVLIALQRFRNEIDKVIVPLVYGGSQEYVKYVIDLGKKLFHNKFWPLIEFIPSAGYLAILNSAKVQVLNHYHQEGLGNSFIMFALKKRVFLRGNISSYAYFKNLGILVHDTRDLLSGSAKLFENMRAIAEVNANIMQQETSEKNLVGLWSKVFAVELQ